jgi:hypothetical protein
MRREDTQDIVARTDKRIVDIFMGRIFISWKEDTPVNVISYRIQESAEGYYKQDRKNIIMNVRSIKCARNSDTRI